MDVPLQHSQTAPGRLAAEAAGDTVVALAQSQRADYGDLVSPVFAPELPSGQATTVAQAAVRELFQIWGLDLSHAGTSSWNPLGVFIAPGSRVVLKPNWVLHWNKSGHRVDGLVTHISVIAAVL